MFACNAHLYYRGIINIFLSAGKFFVGISCHSSALIADAGHSLSDLFSDFITLWAVNVGRLPPDADHPYGHGKFEAIGSLFLSLTLLGTGIGVGVMSNKRLLEILSAQRGIVAAGDIVLPKLPALFMAALSIFSKEWLFRITRSVGERLNSQIVIANAWHHRSDAYSSVLALGSIALAIYVPGLVAVDAAAGLFVAGMICMTGAEIMGESIKQLTDTSNEELVERVTKLAANCDDVLSVNRVRARQVGSASTVDVSVSMPDDKSASAARAVEVRLKQQILQVDGVLDVDVRATSPGAFCPLLEASNSNPVTAAEVEDLVKLEVLSHHPEVESVEGVVVHYEDTVLVNVDVQIRLAMNISVAQANALALDVRKTLENSSQISRAKIFLDLNQDVLSIVN
jgi:cation diffusion facilitator family transporter